MSEQEWKERFVARLKRCFKPPEQPGDEKLARDAADISWPDYGEENPEEAAVACAVEMATE